MEVEQQEKGQKMGIEDLRKMVKNYYMSHKDPKISFQIQNRRYKKLQEVFFFYFTMLYLFI